MEKIRHFSIVVQGRVQGVGYRAFTVKAANNLGITGFVKNRPDGAVLIEAEGETGQLEQFIQICHAGPGWAYVETLVKSESPAEGLVNFKIKY